MKVARLVKTMFAAVAAAVSLSANAAKWTDSNTGIEWAYTVINGNEARITNPDNSSTHSYAAISYDQAVGEITVPTYIDGKRVTEIGFQAFLRCDRITKVNIPSGVKKIGYAAFYICSGLQSIDLPNTVTEVDISAFEGCGNVRRLNLGTGLKKIGTAAFRMLSITDLVLPDSLEEMGTGVFQYCRNLTTIKFPSGMTEIPKQTFEYCSGLVHVNIPNGIKTIDAYAFFDCPNVKFVTIPESVTEIEYHGFDERYQISTVFVGGGSEAARVKELFRRSEYTGYNAINYSAAPPTPKTVTFDANGGTCSVTERTCLMGSTVGKLPRPVKSGYTFTGWWTDASGGSRYCSASVINSDKTFYAQWVDGNLERYVDDDGIYWNTQSSGDKRIISSYDPDGVATDIVMPSTTFGKTVIAINEQFSRGELYKPLKSIMIPASIVEIDVNAFGSDKAFPVLETVYVNKNDAARIEALLRGTAYSRVDSLTFVETDPYYVTITFDVNGGDALDTTTKQVVYGETIGALPTPTKTDGENNWRFDGWFTSASEGTEVTASTPVQHQQYSRLLDQTLYAHWTKLPPNYYTETVGGVQWTYRVSAGAAEIYNEGDPAISTTTEGAIDVPSTLGGYQVTKIGDGALESCPLLTRVKIPSGVTSIGNFAFHSDEALRDLSIPSTVTSIAGNAFVAHSIKTIHVEAGDVDRVRALVEAATSSTIYYVVGFPANDDFASAAAIAGASGSVNGSAVGATTEANEPLVALSSTAGNTVWWTWTAPNDCVATFDTAGSNFDTILGVYTGDALGSVAIVAENDDSLAMTPASRSQVSFNAVSDQTYYIAVGAHNWYEVPGSTADITLNWSTYVPPDYASILGAPAGMSFASSGDKPWVAGGTVDEKTTVKSGLNTTDHSKESVLIATFSGAGTLSFWYKVESEQGWDELEVFIDGGGNCLGGTYQNSGTVPWTKFEEVLGAGDHTVVWKYSKDLGGYAGDDCAWISGVSFGEVAPPVQHTVTFDGNGGLVAGDVATTTRQVNDGAAVGPLPSATRAGYTLAGWFTAASGGTEIETTTPVNADVTYYAHWTEDAVTTYTVTFDKNEGDSVSEASRVVDEGDPVGTPLPTASRSGYTFDGWFTAASGGTQIDGSETVTANVIYYAHWTAVTPKMTVWFNENGSTSKASPALKQVDKGSKIGTLATVSWDAQHTFLGWFTLQIGGDLVDEDYVVNANQTLYAHWQEVVTTYTVTFDKNGGDSVSEASRNVNEGAEVGALPAASRTGYTQAGWWTAAEGGTEVTATTAVNADVTYYAHWTANEYTVNFNANGGSVTPSSKQVTYDAAYGELPTATKDGYWSFAGWWTASDDSGEQVTASTIVKITADQTLYSHWTDTTPDKYTITFDANGGTGGWSRQLEAGAALTAPTVTKTGYTFAGWTPAVPATVPAGNATYTAQWTANKYTITFDANGGTGGTTVQLDYGAALAAPTVTKTGYNFAGWSPAVPSTVPAANSTYTAQWTANKYTITFDANGGEGGTSQQLEYGAALVAPTVTYDGYNFTGWLPAVPATVPAADTTYVAQWTTGKLKVTFDPGTDGEASFGSRDFDFEETLGEVPRATRPGCALLGWFTEPNGAGFEVTPATVVTASFTAYACWNENDGSTIYETAVVDGIEWTYKILGDSKSVELYNRGNPVIPSDTVGSVTVPAKLNGRNVTSINDRAFYACNGVTAAIVPDSVLGVGVDAFAFCTSLQAVQLGKKVGKVGEGAFRYCASLLAVEFKGTEPVLPDADDSTFDGAGGEYPVWIHVPKSAKKWGDAWRGKVVNKYPYNAAPSVNFMEPAENPAFGKISGSGTTTIGGKYTIKATANKGYAFAGWYDASTGALVTRAASYAFVVTGETKSFLADFVTVEDDAASLKLALGDATAAVDGSIEIDLGAATESYSEPKLAVKGLPAGLKYDAKTMKIAGKATKPGIYTVTVSATNASVKKATPGSTAEFTLTVPNFVDAEIPVGDAYGPFTPGVEYVETISGADGCAVAGLPSGMKWTAKEIVNKTTGTVTPANSAYGAATKPGNYTVTFTKTLKELDAKGKTVSVKHVATATFVVGPLPKLTLSMSGATDKDKVAGGGEYPANKTVSLKATAAAGKVFSRWVDASTGETLSYAASYSYTMPSVDKEIVGEFTTKEEDAKHLDIDIGDFAHYDQNRIMEYDNAVWNETTVKQGVYVEWPVAPNTVSFASIAVSGLPSGLKFTAKDIMKKGSKTDVEIPANTIYGTPTTASKPKKIAPGELDPSIVKIKVTTAGKVVANYQLDVFVSAMEEWAAGPFNGGGDDGQTTLTVASTGKISGKHLLVDGRTWTLAADGFSSFDAGGYTATVAAKSGKDVAEYTLNVWQGDAGGKAALYDAEGNLVADLWQTDWKSDPWKTIAAPFKNAAQLGFGDAETWVTLKFAQSGAVTLGGEFLVSGTRIKASGSATVIPEKILDADGSFEGRVYIFFPAKAGKYDGFVVPKRLKWDAATKDFSFVE